MTNIISIVLGLLVLGILVFVHELGHFIVAKLCGIRVLAFSLGFGNPIFKKEVNGTEYRIGTVPFGGYVKMAGENPEEVEGGVDEFQSKPVWQRASVAIAGPLFNYVTAFLMLWVMFIVGTQRPIYLENPTIGAVNDSSIAEGVGILAGDSIITINGKEVADWEAVEAAFAQQEREYTVAVLRDGKRITKTMKMKRSDKAFPKELTGGMQPSLPAVVADIIPGSAADSAGMRIGDHVLSIDEKYIHSWFELITAIGNYTGDSAMVFTVNREGKKIQLSLFPRFDSTAGRHLIGVQVNEGETRTIKYSPAAAVGRAMDKGWEYTTMIFDVLGKLFSRKVSPKQLSGPLGIIPASGFMVLQGLAPILGFMALIGINLAVLNLMPLVITDGGLIFFMIIEVIRRKPLSLKTQLVINRVAIAFFLALFLFISYNDILKLPEYFRLFGR